MEYLDPVANFLASHVATAPSPADTGTSLTVTTGEGVLFPDPATAGEYNLCIYPPDTQITRGNATIVRVTAKSGDTFTIVRDTESSPSRSVLVGDVVAMNPTAKMFEDIDDTLAALNAAIPTTFGDLGNMDDIDNGTTYVKTENNLTDTLKTKLDNIEDGAEVNTVDSVNTKTGAVVLDPDDLDDSGTTNKFTTASDISKLATIEESADVTDVDNVGSTIHGATAKTSIHDNDEFAQIDSEASNVLKRITWANIKSVIKTWYDAVTSTFTNKSIDADNNTISNLEVDNLKADVLDTDLSSVSGSDDTLASAKAIYDFVIAQGYIWKEDWATSTSYSVNDLVTQNDTLYVCLEAHTSGTFSTDLAAGKWSEILKGFPYNFRDEDDMNSDDASGVASQQSIKAYNINTHYAGKDRQGFINGDFDIWQRGSSFTGVTTTDYTADHWRANPSGGTASYTRQTFTAGQTDVPDNPLYYMKIDGTSADDNIGIMQKIESVRSYSGETVTISCWAKADASMTLEIDVLQIFGSGGSTLVEVNPDDDQFTLTTSWQKCVATVNVPSVSGKTIGAGNNLSVSFVNPNNETSTFYIAHVQINKGNDALPFYKKTPQEELLDCMRYYQTGSCGASVNMNRIYAQKEVIDFKVIMYDTPTITFSSSSITALVDINVDSVRTEGINTYGFGWQPYATANGYVRCHRDWEADAETMA